MASLRIEKRSETIGLRGRTIRPGPWLVKTAPHVSHARPTMPTKLAKLRLGAVARRRAAFLLGLVAGSPPRAGGGAGARRSRAARAGRGHRDPDGAEGRRRPGERDGPNARRYALLGDPDRRRSPAPGPGLQRQLDRVGHYALGGVVQVLPRRPTERGLFFDASCGTQQTMNFDLLLRRPRDRSGSHSRATTSAPTATTWSSRRAEDRSTSRPIRTTRPSRPTPAESA
jgi:hypothetical protein